jgi:putative SOS response-associated peptidase YedK
MCGRFTYRLTWEEIVRLYGLTLDQPARNTQARYNVCPTDPVDTIVEREGKRELMNTEGVRHLDLDQSRASRCRASCAHVPHR